MHCESASRALRWPTVMAEVLAGPSSQAKAGLSRRDLGLEDQVQSETLTPGCRGQPHLTWPRINALTRPLASAEKRKGTRRGEPIGPAAQRGTDLQQAKGRRWDCTTADLPSSTGDQTLAVAFLQREAGEGRSLRIFGRGLWEKDGQPSRFISRGCATS